MPFTRSGSVPDRVWRPFCSLIYLPLSNLSICMHARVCLLCVCELQRRACVYHPNEGLVNSSLYIKKKTLPICIARVFSYLYRVWILCTWQRRLRNGDGERDAGKKWKELREREREKKMSLAEPPTSFLFDSRFICFVESLSYSLARRHVIGSHVQCTMWIYYT